MADKVNLAEWFATFDESWLPRVVGDMNDMNVKVVKMRGELFWHKHDSEDEMFIVVKGRLRVSFRDKEERLGPGEFIIIPHGVDHLPVGEPEAEVLFIEPRGTVAIRNQEAERRTGDIAECNAIRPVSPAQN